MNSTQLATFLLLHLMQSGVDPKGPTNLEYAAKFWSETSIEGRDRIAAEWMKATPSFEAVQSALSTGRVYDSDAPTGYLLRQRVSSSGVVHPYLILVPKDYTPEKRWPVRFELHGGMGANEWDPTKAEWAGGWSRTESSLMVFPAGWNQSMWWQASQVENFEAILREVRATWNVDENRVVAVGSSDGGAALFFLGMRVPDRFACYAGYVAPPDRLVRADFEPDGQMHIENLAGQRFHLGYGEKDVKVPIQHLRRYMELFSSVGAVIDWYVLEGQGHTLSIPEEKFKAFMSFVYKSRRDPLPDELSWSTEAADRYARRSWVRIDELAPLLKKSDVDKSLLLPRWGTPIQMHGKNAAQVPFGTVKAKREGNHVALTTTNVKAVTLLLSAAEFDFSSPVRVTLNGALVREEVPVASLATLLRRAARDDDRTMLFAAEWRIDV